MFDTFPDFPDLPKLTDKQKIFVMRYVINGNNASEAYRFAYNALKMSEESVNVEASRLLKNPKITPWINYYKKKAQQNIDEEFHYSVSDAFNELNKLQEMCMNSFKTYSVAKGCIDTKCKIKGLFDEKDSSKSNLVINMGSVQYDGKNLKLNVGEDVANSSA